jgi:magnesium chelatase subunit D
VRDAESLDALDYAESSAWATVAMAAVLFAIDPPGVGGISLRASAGPVREQWLNYLRSLLPPATPVRRVPAQVSDDRLLGGLDLTATLQSGQPVAERGILAAADGGILMLAMAERLSATAAARIAAAMDTHEAVMERDGLTSRAATHFGVVALDEGLSEEEQPAKVLLERLAFHLDLSNLALRDVAEPLFDAAAIEAARIRLAAITIGAAVIESLCSTALALGIDSLRAPLFAIQAARAAAALAGRTEVAIEDASLAGRLVFGSRATVLPQAEPVSNQTSESSPPKPGQEESPQQQSAESSTEAEQLQQPNSESSFNEVVLAATQAAIPPGLLEKIKTGAMTGQSRSAGRAGALRQSALRGRPIGVRKGELRAGVRLNLLATLRAAAPWQKLRGAAETTSRLQIRPEDFHVTRYRQRAETITIFLLDASGSSALHRLAEAKGAVELLLADCYVRRDQVAVLAFRDRHAEVLLPPTRSLVRAKRSLAALPGGGGTPLAVGIDAGMIMAESIKRRGVTPTLVLLTDGRANVTRAGNAGREQAQQEALQAARRVRAAGIGTLLIDTSPRPQPLGQSLATELGARYVPLPYADATTLARAVQVAAIPNRA